MHEEVRDVLKTVCNTTTKFTPGGCTGVMAGPDTHWNKPFKGFIREEMESYMETEEYMLTDAGKIKPAPHKLICDWVVAAWAKVDTTTIINSFVHNGWEQAFNNNDTSVLHQTLRDIVDNNIVRGFQIRAAPEEVGPHNYFTELAKKYLQVSSDVDSDDEHDDVLEELDDFDFYRLQQQDENIEPNACTAGLPVDNVNFSDSSETDSELPQAENRDDGNSDGQQESERSAPEDGEESELEF